MDWSGFFLHLAPLVYLGGPALAALVCSAFLSYNGGTTARLVVGLGGPGVLFAVFAAIVPALWDPSPGCEDECLGRLIYAFWLISSVITLEIGLLVGWGARRVAHGKVCAQRPLR